MAQLPTDATSSEFRNSGVHYRREQYRGSIPFPSSLRVKDISTWNVTSRWALRVVSHRLLDCFHARSMIVELLP